MLRKISVFLLTIFSYLLLNGCADTPQNLGVSQKDWDSYDAAKQHQLIDTFRKIKEQQQSTELDASSKEVSTNQLLVTIADGKAMMPPDFATSQSYQPLTFSINPDTCVDNVLLGASAAASVKLTACYKNQILFLDASHTDPQKAYGTISFHLTPLWQTGFTYNNVNSSGYVRLQNATVTIKLR